MTTCPLSGQDITGHDAYRDFAGKEKECTNIRKPRCFMALSTIHIEYFLERKRNCILGTGGSYLLSMSQVLCCLRAKDNFDSECPAEMGLPTS